MLPMSAGLRPNRSAIWPKTSAPTGRIADDKHEDEEVERVQHPSQVRGDERPPLGARHAPELGKGAQRSARSLRWTTSIFFLVGCSARTWSPFLPARAGISADANADLPRAMTVPSGPAMSTMSPAAKSPVDPVTPT